MSVVEKKADDLGQVIFRLEIHIDLLKRHAQADTTGIECIERIEGDLEKLKDIKRELLALSQGTQ